MALIKTQSMVNDINGPMGGLSYRVRRSTGSVRVTGARRRRSSKAQIEYRAVFQETSVEWGKLSQADRDLWIAWADSYGQAADPEALTTVAGRSRFIGANTMQIAGGRSVIVAPSAIGIGNAEPALVAFFPIEGSDSVEIQMQVIYSSPEVAPAFAALYASPSQPLSSPSNKKRWRRIADIDVTLGGPTGEFLSLVVDLNEVIDRGQMMWFKSKVVTAAGNTSSNAEWPVLMPASNELRAFRLGPVLDFLTPQRYRIEGGSLIVESSGGDSFDIVIEYDLNSSGLNTIGKLFDRINLDGLWRGVNVKPSVLDRPSIGLVETLNTSVTTGQQPSLLRILE